MSMIKFSRRGFIKAAAVTAGYAVFSLNMAKTAAAAALDFVGLRQKSVYDADEKIYKIRKSQDNPMITKLYDAKAGFLHDGPCGHKSHHLLHTEYFDRSSKVKALKDRGIKLAL